MHPHLLEAFRHSAWATRTLILVCRQCSREELRRPARGFGSVWSTLHHVVVSDAVYAGILSGARPGWVASGAGGGESGGDDVTDGADLDWLDARVDETAEIWERLLAGPLDADRTLLLDSGTYECRASVVVVQALSHACGHREQVRAALAAMGVAPPDVQPWTYAVEAERARVV